MEEYRFRGFTIPAHMRKSLDKYIQKREPVGGFLQAVIRNDLFAAVGGADEHNQVNLPAYIAYLYNEAPGECWGSPEKYQAWLEGKNA